MVWHLGASKRKRAAHSKVTIVNPCSKRMKSPKEPIDIPSDPVVDKTSLEPINIDKDIVRLLRPSNIPDVPEPIRLKDKLISIFW